MRVLLSQVKGMGSAGRCTAGGSTDQDDKAATEQSGDECSTSYHHAQDIPGADFRAIGTEFQVSTPCAFGMQQQRR